MKGIRCQKEPVKFQEKRKLWGIAKRLAGEMEKCEMDSLLNECAKLRSFLSSYPMRKSADGVH